MIGGTILTSLLVLVKNIFTPLVSVLFMECQLHIKMIKALILITHEPHACKLLLQAYKHSANVQIWQFLINYTAMHIHCVQLAFRKCI